MENQNEVANDLSTRYLEFMLDGERYAIPLLRVLELISMPETTPVPYSPKYFKGIMNLRGQVISIIDLRLKMGVKEPSEEERSENAVVIVEVNDLKLGLIVDAINKVLVVENQNKDEIIDLENGKTTHYMEAIYKNGEELVVLLELDKIINAKEFKKLTNKAA